MMPHAHAIYAIRDLQRQEYLVEAAHKRLLDQHYPTKPAKAGDRLLRPVRLVRRTTAAINPVRFVLRLAFEG